MGVAYMARQLDGRGLGEGAGRGHGCGAWLTAGGQATIVRSETVACVLYQQQLMTIITFGKILIINNIRNS